VGNNGFSVPFKPLAQQVAFMMFAINQ